MPEGPGREVRDRREFEHCDHKWHKSVPLDAPCSDCYTCKQDVPANDKWLRQFFCCDHIWYAWVTDAEPYSICYHCKERVEAVPRGKEIGVGACTFQCHHNKANGEECGKVYVVLCEMTDTAKCYQCGYINSPILFAPRRRLHRRSSNTHGCSKCGHGTKPNCPNLQQQNDSTSRQTLEPDQMRAGDQSRQTIARQEEQKTPADPIILSSIQC